MFRLRFGLLLAAVIVLLGGAMPAQAHGYIVRSIPADRAVLERAPARLQYWFSEGLEPSFSSLSVRDQTGTVIAAGGVSEEDTSLLTARLPSGLPDGAYVVELRPAFASDGHAVIESRVFFVGEEIGGVTGAAASSQAVPLEILWRVLVLASTLLLFGTFTLYALVLLPAWGNKEHRAGLLPPRVMGRLNAIVAVGLALAFAGNLLALVQQTMVFFNVDAAAVIRQGLWDVVRIGSRFGDVWMARMGFLVVVAVLHAAGIYFRKDQPDAVRAFWAANAWLMALVVGSLSVASHAAGSLIWPWTAMAVDWLHAIGVALWAGGVAALMLVLPVALAPYQGEARRMALLAVMRRFSRLAAACVALVITTGIYSALNWFYAPSELTRTSYGNALLLKLLLVALLLLVAALHHLALNPGLAVRVERWTAFTGPLHRAGIHTFYRLVERAVNFAGTLRLEVALVAVVLASVGLLSATPIPQPDFLKQTVDAPRATQTVEGLSVTVTLSPGGPGVNTYDVLVTRDEQPVDGLNVRLQMVNPARDWRGSGHVAENVDSGLYVTAGDDLDRPGQWWTLVDITGTDGTVRAAFDWSITQDAAVSSSRPPGILNILALIGVLAVLGWIAYPTLHRYYRKLDLSPAAVTVALGVIFMTVLFSVIGFIGVQDAQTRAREALHPPPSVVNTVLPDQASLERGRVLYEAHCAGWQSVERDFKALRDSIGVLRDDELYRAAREGWRKLPPCTGDLTDDQRWDMVNFVRTMGSS